MKKQWLLILAFVTFQSCATSYKGATSAQYLGNDTYLISASGNGHTSHSELTAYLKRKAFETCLENKNSGFVVSGNIQKRTSESEVNAGFGNTAVISLGSQDLMVKCEGPVDQQLIAEFKEK